MWHYRNPVEILFGENSFDRLATMIDGQRYAIVTYDEPYFDGLVRKLETLAGQATAQINNIKPNPDFAMLRASIAQLNACVQTPDILVAIGGGSVIDAAKVLAIGGNGFDAILNHLGAGTGAESLPDHSLPILAVPTTAGTGSEVTPWATLWDSKGAKKYSLAREDLFPTHAVVDPLLTAGLPLDQTISTGLDALSHALESLWNVNANPISTNYAVRAARDILECLRPLTTDLRNSDLRHRMAQASILAGLAFSGTRTALAHSLSYPVTLHHKVPHGVACSFTLPKVMRSAINADSACDNALREIFGDDLVQAPDRLGKLLADLGIPEDHQAHGISDREWRAWIDDAIDGERGQNFIASRNRVHTAFRISSAG